MRATATLALLMIALPVRAQCVRLPDPVGPTDPQARFRTARAHYDAGRLGEAAVLVRSTALDPAAGELAEPAADLCLDALSSAAERDLSCAWELALSAEQLQAALCIAPVAPRREGFCERLDRLRCAVVARVIERLAADQRYEAALHLSLQHLTSACPDRDQVLHNAAIFAERVGNRARASSLRQELIARHPRSPLAAGALHALAAERRGVADYAAAADLYERFAERYPAERASCDQPRACPDAIRALETAVFLRMALGELDLAIRDADRFARNYARSEPARTAEIAIGIVARLESAGRTREARTRAEAILRSPDPAPIDVRLLASVIAARTSTGAARASHLEVARALSPSVERAVVDRHPEPDEQALRLARAR
ncbi:MAG: hypothetical protein IT378_14665, partial [Sandaracinaceae bacterium]|nr:hypothetical protein [Sandaracinaceae bacterium]